MHVRKITPQEQLAVMRVSATAFLFEISDETTQKLAAAPLDNGHENVWAAFDDDTGTLTASMVAYPCDMRFDGNVVRMSGIGNVASLPEHRMLGSVRAIFQAVLDEDYNTGTAFSALYPFSYGYYRKFGYELTTSVLDIEVPMETFGGMRSGGKLTQWFFGMDFAPLKRVYDLCTRQVNQTFERTDKQWEGQLKHDPYKDKRYIYTWSDDAGVVQSYGMFRPERRVDHSVLVMEELAYANRDGFYGMMSLLRTLGAQFSKLVATYADWMPAMADSFGDPYSAVIKLKPRVMQRVVNLPAALAALRVPCAEGNVCFALSDPMIAANNGVFTVTWQDGKARLSQGGEPEFGLTIGQLTQLVLGYLSFDEALMAHREIVLSGDGAGARALFVKKRQAMWNYF